MQLIIARTIALVLIGTFSTAAVAEEIALRCKGHNLYKNSGERAGVFDDNFVMTKERGKVVKVVLSSSRYGSETFLPEKVSFSMDGRVWTRQLLVDGDGITVLRVPEIETGAFNRLTIKTTGEYTSESVYVIGKAICELPPKLF